eukprot:CAMPEP_0202791580 /NCGR_PEP_ID=MMETSP1388-20130828/81865_1 /ASSEMBLY_ACC=CAM_ASM_000864 /TAXON_ID=37098 /ORGANISM="Isochrysis sp, Strain CCMP1244" /LENGTH=97 /DNA_ID=CAMNT_0049461347 /DNA_START=90 /DNA_END=380 /DNA_ORIENTATION=+
MQQVRVPQLLKLQQVVDQLLQQRRVTGGSRGRVLVAEPAAPALDAGLRGGREPHRGRANEDRPRRGEVLQQRLEGREAAAAARVGAACEGPLDSVWL